MASSVDPRKIYSALYSAQQPQPAQQQQPDLNLGLGGFDIPQNWGSPSGAPVNPEAPNAPAPSNNSSLFGTWNNFLKALGTTEDPRAEASNWVWKNGLMFRRGGEKNLKGFNLFGLAPMEIYEANLAGNGLDREPTTRIAADAFWKSLMNPGDWGVHDDPNAPGVAKDWLKQDLDALQSVWGQLSAADKQVFRDRMLNGMGLPAYLQNFLKARPQWITDYISNTFKV